MFAPSFDISPSLLDTLKGVAVKVHELNRARIPRELRAELRRDALAAASHAATTAGDTSIVPEGVRSLLRHPPDSPPDTDRAVLNYHAALNAQDANSYDGESFGSAQIRDIHGRLMAGLLEPESCGHYRKEPALMLTPDGGDVAFWFPYHAHVPHHVDALHTFVSENPTLDPILLAGVYYKQFRLIHPFTRGNGRSTRLACRVLLRRLGISSFELLAFERAWRHDPAAYHEHLWEPGSFYDLDPDFGPWLEYVATGVLKELERLATDIETRRTRHLRLKTHHRIVLEHLELHGSITDRTYADLVERAKATRSLDFRLLLDLGLIERRGRGPAIYYVLA